jgi:hypothetical protein
LKPGYVANPASAPARETWYADPAKVFDNVYFVGGKVHSSWALTTEEGIIIIDSQRHIAARAAAAGASVILSNHSEFDNAFNRNRMLAGRGDGPHPYEVGSEWVQRYFQVMQGCARAAQLRLEQQLAMASGR